MVLSLFFTFSLVFSFKASNGGAETPERGAATTSRRAAARTVTVGRDQVPRWGIHLQREFYRAVQIQADSHTASHTWDPVPKRNRTLPKQYPSQAHERQSQSKTRRMLRCGRSPVRKTLRNNGCKY